MKTFSISNIKSELGAAPSNSNTTQHLLIIKRFSFLHRLSSSCRERRFVFGPFPLSKFNFNLSFDARKLTGQEAAVRQQVLLNFQPQVVEVLEAVLIEHRDVIVVVHVVAGHQRRGLVAHPVVLGLDFLGLHLHGLPGRLAVLLVAGVRPHVPGDHITTARCVVALRTAVWLFTLNGSGDNVELVTKVEAGVERSSAYPYAFFDGWISDQIWRKPARKSGKCTV